jgi:hypothetical protein
MIETYNTKTCIRLSPFTIELEESVSEIPVGYDEEGDALSLRVVVSRDRERIVCESFQAFRNAIAKFGVPLAKLCEQFPLEVAQIVSELNGLSRVVQDTPLFQSLKATVGLPLANLAPQLVGNNLIWHELIGIPSEVRRHQMSIPTMEVLE